MNITREQFTELKNTSEDFLFIKEMEGDELTPIAVYYRLVGEKKFLLESSLKKEEKGRYSFIGMNPYLEIKSYGENINVTSGGITKTTTGKVLDIIKHYINATTIQSELPFVGGAVGYIGYDVIRQYEKLETMNIDDMNIPEACMMFYKQIVIFDHELQKVFLLYVYRKEDEATYEKIENNLEEIALQLQQSSTSHPISVTVENQFTSNIEQVEFLEMVEKSKEYIRDGDIFQVVLSQRFQTSFKGDPFDLYRRLRVSNPSPYLYYMDFDGYQVIGSSPESVISVQGKSVKTNPIAGTRKRGVSKEEDESLEQELLNSEKERAEHMMLLDLGRNDLGFVSEIGSITVPKYMEVERYSHVMHLVSEVEGELRDGMTCFEALRYCLPAGTVSGGPKVRAMSIIDELEKERRAIYSGTVGYISFTGDMEMALAIRTIVTKENIAYVQAGAGVVYDSVPQHEYEETLNKAKALMEVLV